MYEDQNQNVRNSIAVYKTDRKLVELRDKLNPSFWGNYAELHGHADVDGNGKVYSNIGVVLYDYSNGTGNNTVKVYVNVTPEDIYWLYNALTSHTENFELEQTKIFGQPDNNGYSQMTKLRIARAGVDKNGAVRRYPWCISAENGVGIAQHTKIGGTYCKSGSYQSIRKAFINLSDYDFFRLINRTVRYIAQFENTYCPPIIGDGRIAYGQMLMQRQMANNPTQYR